MNTKRWGRVMVGLVVATALIGVGARVEAASPPPPQVDLDVDGGGPALGEPIRLEARVERNRPARPTGTVAFVLDGTTTLATAKLRSTATPADTVAVTTRAVPAGTHQITAVYSGDGRYPSVTSRARQVTVSRGSTTITLRSALAEVATGTTARFIAKVGPVAPATATPTGSVRFAAGSVVRTVPLEGGLATWRPRLPDGVHQVTATFVTNDQWREGPAAGPISQRVGPDGPRVDQQNTTQADFSDIMFSASGTYRAAAQIVVAGIPGMLTAVEVDAACFGVTPAPGAMGDLPIQIKAPIGDAPTGGLLATSPAPVSYDEELGLARYELSTPVPVSVGTRIAIVLNPPSNVLGCTAGMAASGTSAFSFGGGWEGRTAAIRHRTWVDPV